MEPRSPWWPRRSARCSSIRSSRTKSWACSGRSWRAARVWPRQVLIRHDPHASRPDDRPDRRARPAGRRRARRRLGVRVELALRIVLGSRFPDDAPGAAGDARGDLPARRHPVRNLRSAEAVRDGGYLVAGLAELLIFFFRPEPLVGRGIFAMNVAVFAGVATAGRFVYSLVGTDFFKHQALVVTSGEVGAPLLGELKRAAGAVYQIQGYVAPARDMSAPNTVPWLGDGADLTELLAARKIDTIIVSSSMECWHRYLQALIAARNRGVEIVDLASVCESFLNRIPCDQITELWLLWGLMGR